MNKTFELVPGGYSSLEEIRKDLKNSKGDVNTVYIADNYNKDVELNSDHGETGILYLFFNNVVGTWVIQDALNIDDLLNTI